MGAYELWLIWQNPHSRQRYHVGTLRHVEQGYQFAYEKHGPRTLPDALADGYRLHLVFPDTDKTYHARELFAAFSRRLPDRSRPDFLDILKRIGLSRDHTPMDLLWATGGRLATDTYEFVSPIILHDGCLNIDFIVAGWRYYEGESVKAYLRSNVTLLLEQESTNPFDQNAVLVLYNESIKLGYVPAYYSWAVAELLRAQNTVRVSVLQFDQTSDPDNPLKVSLSSVVKHTTDALLMASSA
ncbi:MAG: HIRAN domain-containing protein [Armatimonadota bacterium]